MLAIGKKKVGGRRESQIQVHKESRVQVEFQLAGARGVGPRDRTKQPCVSINRRPVVSSMGRRAREGPNEASRQGSGGRKSEAGERPVESEVKRDLDGEERRRERGWRFESETPIPGKGRDRAGKYHST